MCSLITVVVVVVVVGRCKLIFTFDQQQQQKKTIPMEHVVSGLLVVVLTCGSDLPAARLSEFKYSHSHSLIH